VSEKKCTRSRHRRGEQKKGWGAEEAEEAGGAGGEERIYNFWTQSSRNPTQNFVHPYRREDILSRLRQLYWVNTLERGN